jgi:hypothetical protein
MACIERGNSTTRCAVCGSVPQILHRPLLGLGKSYCPRCCKRCAAKAATSKPAATAPAPAKQPAAVASSDVPGSQWKTAPPRRPDPWYSDDRRGASRGSSWIPDRPGWLQAGSAARGRGAQQQSAAIIRPDGGVQQVDPPDYQPTPFVPRDR